MKNSKFLFIAMIFLVSLVCISAVSAADDAASDVIADNTDETVLEESIDDDGLQVSENEKLEEIDENVLSDNSETGLANSNDDSLGSEAVASFSYIRDELQTNDELNLTYNVFYEKTLDDEGLKAGIPITKDCTIDGQGHTISGTHQARIFYVDDGAHLTLKNLNLENGISEWGGAIFVYDGSSLTVINCTFTGNVADVVGSPQGGIHTPEGGAILVKYNSNCDIIDSMFEGNTANATGGALVGCYDSNINIVNTTFINNGVIDDIGLDWTGGDAIRVYEGTNLVISKSTFDSNNAGNAQLSAIKVSGSSVTVSDSTFSNEEALGGGAMYGGTAINCTFTGNQARAGGAIYDGTAINCTFSQNKAIYSGGAISDGTAINCTFSENHANNDGGAMHDSDAINCNFNRNYADYGGAISGGTATDCNFTNNSAENYGGAISAATATNCNFIENSAYEGGALNSGTATNCNFIGNSAENYGGAICEGSAINCTFSENYAKYFGGALYKGEAVNCTFTANRAAYGGAMSGDEDDRIPCSAIGCDFINNSAWAAGAVYMGDAINCTFTGNYLTETDISSNDGAAMSGFWTWEDNTYPCHAVNCIFTNNNADNRNAIFNGIADSCIFNGDTVWSNVDILLPTLSMGYYISTYNSPDMLAVDFKSNSGMQIDNANILVSVYTTAGAFVGNYTALSGGWKVPLNAGAYLVTYAAKDFDIDSVQNLIVIDKAKSAITSKAVTVVYNNNKYLVITLKDAYGKAISGAKVTVTLASAKTYKTDKNGQIKINVGKLVPKTYTAKISFAGNANILASSTTAKVTVKKATPKMTAKAKTFKVAVKTKKYTITLKNNKGKVLKSTKVTLKVNKKTFTAKTNKKGVATFKITNLKKKGKFTAVVKFAGNKYYNKLTKKVKITVKK